MSKSQNLQDSFLNVLRKERVPVAIYLVNGIKLQGIVDSFDQYVVVLKSGVSQMVYKHAISTIVPVQAVKIPLDEEDGYEGEDDDMPYGNQETAVGYDDEGFGDEDNGPKSADEKIVKKRIRRISL